VYSSGFGGCCDCGNELAWRKSGYVHHRAATRVRVCVRVHVCIHRLTRWSVCSFCAHHRGRDSTHVFDPIPAPMKPLILQTFASVCKLFKRSLSTRDLSSHMNFSLACIAWLRKMAGLGDSVRYGCGRALLRICLSDDHEPEDDSYPPGSLLHELGATLPYQIGDQLINLYLEILYDDDFKCDFGRRKHYPSLADRMLLITDKEAKQQWDDFISRVTAQVRYRYQDVRERSISSYSLARSLSLTPAVERTRSHRSIDSRSIDRSPQDHRFDLATCDRCIAAAERLAGQLQLADALVALLLDLHVRPANRALARAVRRLRHSIAPRYSRHSPRRGSQDASHESAHSHGEYSRRI